MDLRPYVEALRRDVMLAAEAGGEDARAIAERLLAPLESAVRLTLLDALSNAADEITRDVSPLAVDVRLRGVDPSFVVVTVADPPAQETFETEEGPAARINFRPPEQLKVRIEEAAGREGLSVNAWLIRTVAAALGTRTRGKQ